MLKSRYLVDNITADLGKKMVFIGGPRQVGKTTLAKQIGQINGNCLYLNWDNRADRKNILDSQYPTGSRVIIFDEIHKYKHWKNYVKGIYDKLKDELQILVTGSARLDLYRRGGDSLLGRYHYYRLHPFSVREALESPPVIDVGKKLSFLGSTKEQSAIFNDLLKYGGFPEPFLARDETVARRFRNERVDRLIKEDIRDLETLKDLSALQILVEFLPSKVGSLFSANSLREDLQVAHRTISNWLDILERFYYHFRIYPFQATAIKSLRKEPKMYLWDWSEVKDGGARLENIVASHLLKFTHYLHDSRGYKAELFFLRDIDGHETDFLVTIDRRPWFAVEVKASDATVATNPRYFGDRLHIPFLYQVVHTDNNVDFVKNGVRVISIANFLSGLV